MMRVRIVDLLANAPVDPEAHLDTARVERYARMLDALPPVVVFDTPEGLLLTDGYHRVVAARRRGLETVEAEVRSGSQHDALGMQRGWVPHSMGSPPRMLPRTSSEMPRSAEPRSAECTNFGERR
jgi:hypothetical protein